MATKKARPVVVTTAHRGVFFGFATDTTGETRSDERAIQVGFAALQASMSCDEWQTEAKAVELAEQGRMMLAG